MCMHNLSISKIFRIYHSYFGKIFYILSYLPISFLDRSSRHIQYKFNTKVYRVSYSPPLHLPVCLFTLLLYNSKEFYSPFFLPQQRSPVVVCVCRGEASDQLITSQNAEQGDHFQLSTLRFKRQNRKSAEGCTKC